MSSRLNAILIVLISLGAAAVVVNAEDGYRLWLRYDALPAPQITAYRARARSLVVNGNSARLDAIRSEMETGLSGLLGEKIRVSETIDEGAVIVGTPRSSALISGLKIENQLSKLGGEGYIILSLKIKNRGVIVITSNSETGALYGGFHFLRLVQTLQPIDQLNISEKPKLNVRMLDYWDNLDDLIERGYAGKSLWNWAGLPEKVDARLVDYARANASIGINGAALNNVNADARILTGEYLKKIAAIAKVFRPYGIKVYLSATFSAPVELGGLKTADPFDENVKNWWKRKADEIYRVISRFRRLSGQSEQ